MVRRRGVSRQPASTSPEPADAGMTEVPSIPPSERYPGRPPSGRLVVIAPTRASCETIELGIHLTGITTLIEEEHGEEIRELARRRAGFGIVAGTGTGKTLAIRPIAEEIVGLPLRTGVVNREREATPETPTWNVVVVTTGIARRWLQDGLMGPEDTVVVDEIHQTSAELELCLALAKRAGCRFIWLSATVDPTFFRDYLDAEAVIESTAYDPDRAADVSVSSTNNALRFLSDRFLRHVHRQSRGVAVFVPTRAETEEVANVVGERWRGIHTEYYHGGEPITKLRPFLESEPPKPYVLAMTSAGQSALNIRGLDTVVIVDAQFTMIVERGRKILTRLPLGANEILQMAGRVHGRVEGGEVFILTERSLHFPSLQPEVPNFQLAGDPERVALTCADVGVDATDLDLPVPLDRVAYRRAIRTLERRGLIENGRLTPYGRSVEVLPVDRPWGELLVRTDEDLLPVVATCASVESLHRMTKPDRRIGHHIVRGSDHLTAYNLYASALESCGRMGTVYGLPRHVFDPEVLAAWAEERGVLVRAIEDGALALASIYRTLDLELPATLPSLSRDHEHRWRELLAEVMPFDLMLDGETAWGESIEVSRTSVCKGWSAVAGNLTYFSDKHGRVRGSIEGTEFSYELVWKHASEGVRSVVYDTGHPQAPLRVRTSREFHGFELDASEEPIDRFPEDLVEEAREALAEAMAAGAAYHPDAKKNRRVLKTLREVHRRSGGTARAASEREMRDRLLERLSGVTSYEEFMEAELKLELDDLLPEEERERWLAMPDTVQLRGKEYPLDYAIEDGEPIVRARVPAKTVMELSERDLPDFDRPLHWTVIRGKKSAIRAESLEEAQASVTRRGSSQPRRKGQRKGGKRRGRR
jgi:ATP-dependent helicase HrpA